MDAESDTSMAADAVQIPATLAEGWPPDRVLAGRAAEGDMAAFEELVRRHEVPLFRYLFRSVGNSEEAEDLTQETFLRAFRHCQKFDTRKPFKPWLYRIATNLAVSYLRRAGRYVSLEQWQEEASPVAGEGAGDARDRLEHEQQRRLLAVLMEELPPAARQLLHLYYREELTMEEVGAVMQKKPGAVRTALHRAREQLRLLVQRKEGKSRES